MNTDESLPMINDRKSEGDLFHRVVSILEQARTNVVRTVNSSMVVAYGLIGREIVEEVQNGEKRAEYGKLILEELSLRLNGRYGKGFSVANLKNFRQFYQTYWERLIRYLSGSELNDMVKRYPAGGESQKPHPTGAEFKSSFNPNLSWSHYRALMRVSK